jgi:hypothetical protein
VERFLDHLNGMPAREALHTSGALSDEFWLRDDLSKKFSGPA